MVRPQCYQTVGFFVAHNLWKDTFLMLSSKMIMQLFENSNLDVINGPNYVQILDTIDNQIEPYYFI
jgi:hypothetical protein